MRSAEAAPAEPRRKTGRVPKLRAIRARSATCLAWRAEMNSGRRGCRIRVLDRAAGAYRPRFRDDRVRLPAERDPAADAHGGGTALPAPAVDGAPPAPSARATAARGTGDAYGAYMTPKQRHPVFPYLGLWLRTSAGSRVRDGHGCPPVEGEVRQTDGRAADHRWASWKPVSSGGPGY
jgi:hypothetical protein